MNKNQEKLESFTLYCETHPEERFWQAMRNWNQLKNPKHNFILTAEIDSSINHPWKNQEDTFYEE